MSDDDMQRFKWRVNMARSRAARPEHYRAKNREYVRRHRERKKIEGMAA